MKLQFKLLHKDAKVPTRAHPTDAGFDLYSVEAVEIKAGEGAVISTGIASEFPDGHFVSVRDRSGLSFKYSLHILGGVIDSSYRGEWKVKIVNLGENDYVIEKGDRIAQGVMHKLPEFDIVETDSLDETERGKEGFGSSGKK